MWPSNVVCAVGSEGASRWAGILNLYNSFSLLWVVPSQWWLWKWAVLPSLLSFLVSVLAFLFLLGKPNQQLGEPKAFFRLRWVGDPFCCISTSISAATGESLNKWLKGRGGSRQVCRAEGALSSWSWSWLAWVKCLATSGRSVTCISETKINGVIK